MIKKQEKTYTFADAWLSHTEKKWDKHWMKQVKELINWNKFGYRLNKLYVLDNGRPGWDPLLLLRCLVLVEWYGMSDEALEEAIEFRIDFRKFVGLNWEDSAPDATTYCVFRKRIAPILEKLLRILNAQIEEAGFEVKKAIAVDASLIEAHSKPVGGKGGDTEASWRGFPGKELKDQEGNKVLARRPALYCYKLNASVSVGQGFVHKVTLCKGSEHETHHFRELLSKQTEAAYADKGYVGNKKKPFSAKDFIQFKASRNKPLTPCQALFNKAIVPKRRIVEAVFGSWKRWYGWHQTKYMGLAKNQAAANLTAIAWNIKKWGRYSPPITAAVAA